MGAMMGLLLVPHRSGAAQILGARRSESTQDGRGIGSECRRKQGYTGQIERWLYKTDSSKLTRVVLLMAGSHHRLRSRLDACEFVVLIGHQASCSCSRTAAPGAGQDDEPASHHAAPVPKDPFDRHVGRRIVFYKLQFTACRGLPPTRTGPATLAYWREMGGPGWHAGDAKLACWGRQTGMLA